MMLGFFQSSKQNNDLHKISTGNFYYAVADIKASSNSDISQLKARFNETNDLYVFTSLSKAFLFMFNIEQSTKNIQTDKPQFACYKIQYPLTEKENEEDMNAFIKSIYKLDNLFSGDLKANGYHFNKKQLNNDKLTLHGVYIDMKFQPFIEEKKQCKDEIKPSLLSCCKVM